MDRFLMETLYAIEREKAWRKDRYARCAHDYVSWPWYCVIEKGHDGPCGAVKMWWRL